MAEDQIEILDVIFLTPALLRIKLDGKETSLQVSVDLVNRKVYQGDREVLSEEVFGYLDMVNSLPEDFFIAPDEIIERAAEAQASLGELQNQDLVGDN